MAERTLYDTLEVSSSAAADTIVAAHERLAAKFDPAKAENTSNPAARIQHDAIKQAFLTLGDAEKRAQYDRKLELRQFTPVQQVAALEPFWTLPKMIVAGVIILGLGGFFFKYQKDQARLEAEKVIAVAKAKEAEEKAKAETEVERLAILRDSERERAARLAAAQQRSERDADVNQYQRDTRVNEVVGRVLTSADRAQAQRDDSARRLEEMRVKRDEAQAAAVSRQSLARDKAELCRIERERYGRALSC